MKYIEFNKNDSKIRLYGNLSTIEKEKEIIENLELTGNESKDRLIIQECIDREKIKSEILYNSNRVYSFEQTVKSYRKMQEKDSLEKMTEYMYEFFTNACGDIAHYDIYSYKDYYDFSLRNLEKEILQDNIYTGRFTDLDKIFRELKIGKYFKERENININELSLKSFKLIIKECGWKVVEKNNKLELTKQMIFNQEFSFKINIINMSIQDIYDDINYYAKDFDANVYAETLYDKRKDLQLNINQIVSLSNYIKDSLNELSSNLIYKSKVAAEEKNYNKCIDNKFNNIDTEEKAMVI